MLSIVVLVFGTLYSYFDRYLNRPQIVFGQLGESRCLHSLIKSSNGSAGWDIYSNEIVTIPRGSRILVKTGITINELPNYLYLRVAPRSGLSCKGIDIGAGVIDSDYRGEIKILIINNSCDDFDIDKKTRIAQLIPETISTLPFYLSLPSLISPIAFPIQPRTRNSGGFGSSGK